MAEIRREKSPDIQQIDISRRPATGRNVQGRPSQGRAMQSGGTVRQNREYPERRTAQDSRQLQQNRKPQGSRQSQQSRQTQQNRQAQRRKKRRNSMGAVLAVSLLVLLILAGIGIYLHGRVEKTYVLEAGQSVQAEKLIAYGNSVPLITRDLTAEQITTPGEYDIKVRLAPFQYTVKVTVQDTVAPTATGVAAFCKYGESLPVEAFAENVQDATDVTYSFEQQPDFTKAGEQEVILTLKDEGGNLGRVVSSLYISNLMNELVIEAGSGVPDPGDFLDDIAGFENTEIYYVTDPGSIDALTPGSREVILLVDGRESKVVLTVQDTVAPQFTVKQREGWTLKPMKPEDFVTSVVDATTVTYTYRAEPDWTAAGSGSVEIIATDVAGNSSSQIASYKLKEDKVAPEVSLSTIDIIIGEAVSYKKAVGYSDNADSKAELKLEIDNSKVDPNTVGTYKVTYTVTDTAGNYTTKTGEVYVMAEKPVYYDENVVNEKADEVLAQILKEDMTLRERAKAIYNWVHSKIGYINHSEKGDWVRGAYEGLVKRQGDCFVYASTAKVLLTRAGITNMDIVKSQVNPSHYWNLVDLGEGWYHFDATPRKDKTVFFMWTDAELMEYSQSHKNTHIYDASLYPEIN